MRRLSLSRRELTLFLAVSGVACFTGSAVGARFFTAGSAFAQTAANAPPARTPAPQPPLVVMVPPDGEFFVGHNRNTLMTVREEGNGGILEVYDPSGRRIVVNDLDTRLRGVEARIRLVELAQEKSGVATPKIDTDNPFDKRP